MKKKKRDESRGSFFEKRAEADCFLSATSGSGGADSYRVPPVVVSIKGQLFLFSSTLKCEMSEEFFGEFCNVLGGNRWGL